MSRVFKFPGARYVFLLLIAAIVVTVVLLHLSQTERFIDLVTSADPKWVVLAVLLQLGTYLCAGGIFYAIIREGGRHIPIHELSRLSLERLSVNQLVPAAGVSGHAFVYFSIRHRGLPKGVAVEALFMETLSFYTGYALATLGALAIVLSRHTETFLSVSLLGIFILVSLFVPGAILWLFANKERTLPKWLTRFKPVRSAVKAVRSASAERIRSPKLIAITTLLSALVFVLDGGTLWSIMQMIDVPIDFLTAFAAFTIASVTGAISLLPGGIGGFEAASVLSLTHFGVDLGTAFVATFLLRGVTLWLPLVPGALFATRYVGEPNDEE